jgi:hypothetical protein
LSKYDESSGEEKGESVSISWRNKLRQSLKVYTMILALWALTVKAQENLPLKLITTTPMPGFTGDFDHFGLDLKGNRLFLAVEEHKTVEVFDLRTGARIHSIEGFAHPHDGLSAGVQSTSRHRRG